MIVLIVICLLIIMDLFLCMIYCSHMKRRSDFHGTDSKNAGPSATDGGGTGQNEEASNEKISLKQQIKRGLVSLLNSLLRLTLFIVSYIPSHHIRNFLYRHVFQANLGKGAVIYYGAEIRAPWNLYIGKGSIIGDKALLDARSGIYIGENVNFSTGVWIYTLQHDLNAKDFSTAGEDKPIVIRDRAWVSTRTVILPGVTIEEGTVIAAGAVMTKSTEPFSVYGGVPGKKIGERNRQIDYVFDGGHLHFL